MQSSKFSTSIFWWLFILHHSHSLKICFRNDVCVCVFLCLSVWPSPIVEPKPIYRSRSNFFILFSPTPKIKGSWDEKKILNFYILKKAQTILIKFGEFIVHSKPNSVILANFPGKIPETGKIFFKSFPSPNAGPKPNHQSRSNSIYRILLQIFLAIIFVFDPPLKLRVVHIGKSYKISILSKLAPTKSIKFCRFTVHSKPNNEILANFPEKSLKLEKKFNFFPSPNVGPKPTHQSRSNSIYGIPLQILIAIIFVLDLPLKLRVVHIRKI